MNHKLVKAAVLGIALGLWEVLFYWFSFMAHFTQQAYVCQNTCGWQWVPSVEMPFIVRIIVFLLLTVAGAWVVAGIWFVTKE